MKSNKNESDSGFAPESLYQNTIDAIDSLIHMVDTDLNIILVNKQFYSWTHELGLEYKNVIGKKLFEIFPFLPEKVLEEYNQVFKTGKPLFTEESTEIKKKKIRTETKKIPRKGKNHPNCHHGH